MSFKRLTVNMDLRHPPPISEQEIENSLMRKTLKMMPTHFFTIPPNVYQIEVIACGGGAAGECANLQEKIAGQGGAAGFVQRTCLRVHPNQRFEVRVGLGGRYHSQHEPLTWLQVEQQVYEKREPQDTILFDCDTCSTVLLAQGGKGFCGGRGLPKQQCGESGIAAFPNGGNSFCDAYGKWVGYGGGGGGGRNGGVGGGVYSNKRSSKPSDAEDHSGCGGGGCALVLSETSKNFLPGSGAAGFVQILFER